MVRQIKNIFMSYSRDDKHWTYEFAKALREDLNFSVFVDYRSIYIGTNWWRTICENIESADCIIYVMTPKSIESIYCTAEINYALALNKPILPIMLKSCTFPPSLSNKQVQYLTLRDDMQIEKILIEIQKGLFEVQRFVFSGAYNPPNPTPPQPDEPKAQDTKSAEEVFEYGATLAYEGQLDQAELLYQQAHDATRDASLKREIERAQAELSAYKRIVRYANNPATLRNARNLWAEYLTAYGAEFDPLELGQKLVLSPSKIETPPPKIFTPTRKSLELMPKPFAWCDIPAGKVTLTDIGGYLKEPTTFEVGAFQMSKYPITNAQYRLFVEAGGYKQKRWWTHDGWRAKLDAWDWVDRGRVSGWVRTEKEWDKPLYWDDSQWNGINHPVVGISWYEAIAFCQWMSFKTGENITLPTEQQWQWASQGSEGYEYPWGNTFDKNRCNTSESGIRRTTPVTQYEGKVDSPFGVVDMSGNVWKWCLTEYVTESGDLREDKFNVLRGGSWNSDKSLAENFYRRNGVPYYRHSDVGFFIVCHP